MSSSNVSIELITREPRRYHVSQDTVREFEQVIAEDPRVIYLHQNANLFSTIPTRGWDLLTAAYRHLHWDQPIAQRDKSRIDSRFLFAVLMGLNTRKVVPEIFLRRRKSVYLFDAWSTSHVRICDFAKSYGLEYLFISSRQAARRLGEKLTNTICEWVPEGIIPQHYHFAPPEKKDIDVLQLGRRYDDYHAKIVTSLAQAGKTYLYEKETFKIIFAQREDYLDGLARSKISICVPANRTHPLRAGNIETMTARYLQSMASKCLIVGHAPEEMIDLFGYNPVIEIDTSKPAEQLLSLLETYSDYESLIEKNYRLVREKHGWRNRWQQISTTLFGSL